MKMRRMCNILAVVTILVAVGVVLLCGNKLGPSIENKYHIGKSTVIENTTVAGKDAVVTLSIDK